MERLSLKKINNFMKGDLNLLIKQLYYKFNFEFNIESNNLKIF